MTNSTNRTDSLILWALFAAWSCVAEAHEWKAEGVTVSVDSSGAAESVTICWEPVEEAEGYQIYNEELVARLDSIGPPSLHRLLRGQAEAGERCAAVASIDGDPPIYVVYVLMTTPRPSGNALGGR